MKKWIEAEEQMDGRTDSWPVDRRLSGDTLVNCIVTTMAQARVTTAEHGCVMVVWSDGDFYDGVNGYLRKDSNRNAYSLAALQPSTNREGMER